MIVLLLINAITNYAMQPAPGTRHFFTDLLRHYQQNQSFDLSTKSKATRDDLRKWVAYAQDRLDEFAKELHLSSDWIQSAISRLKYALEDFDSPPPARPAQDARHFFTDQIKSYLREGKFHDLATKSPRTRSDIMQWAKYAKRTKEGAQELLNALRQEIGLRDADFGKAYMAISLLEKELQDIQTPELRAKLPAATQTSMRPGSPLQAQEKIHLINPNDPIVKNKVSFKDGMLLQLDTVSQFDPSLAEYGYATCPSNAVRNALLVQTFAHNGWQNKNSLKDLSLVRTFMEQIKKCTQSLEWFDDEAVQNILKNSTERFNVNPHQISVISSVLTLLDKTSEKQKEIEKIRKGLQLPNYTHAIIVGTLDDDYYAGRNYHYFAFNIIKEGPQVQYIVTDTAPARDHTKGFDNRRLQFLVDMIKNGRSDINFDAEAQTEARKGIHVLNKKTGDSKKFVS